MERCGVISDSSDGNAAWVGGGWCVGVLGIGMEVEGLEGGWEGRVREEGG